MRWVGPTVLSCPTHHGSVASHVRRNERDRRVQWRHLHARSRFSTDGEGVPAGRGPCRRVATHALVALCVGHAAGLPLDLAIQKDVWTHSQEYSRFQSYAGTFLDPYERINVWSHLVPGLVFCLLCLYGLGHHAPALSLFTFCAGMTHMFSAMTHVYPDSHRLVRRFAVWWGIGQCCLSGRARPSRARRHSNLIWSIHSGKARPSGDRGHDRWDPGFSPDGEARWPHAAEPGRLHGWAAGLRISGPQAQDHWVLRIRLCAVYVANELWKDGCAAGSWTLWAAQQGCILIARNSNKIIGTA